jgi:hypothetical protein
MPDIRTALLNAWAQDEEQTIKEKTMAQPHRFKPTNNASRETFSFIKNNPNLTAKEIVAHMTKRGFKENSTTSLCTQMLRQGMVSRDTRGGLRVMQDEYAPLKSYKKREKIKAEKVKFGKPEEKSAGLAALAPQDKVDTSRSTIVLNRNWTAQGVVDKLSVMQARELYDLLKKIFGG